MKLTEMGFAQSSQEKAHYLAVNIDPSGPQMYRSNRKEDLSNWPRAVRVAFIAFDEDQKVIDSGCEIIKQPRPLPAEGFFSHKVTDEIWKKEGVKPEIFFVRIWEHSINAKVFIGIDAKFQHNLLEANMRRFTITNEFGMTVKKIEDAASYVLQLPKDDPKHEYAIPSLEQIYNFLFPNEPLDFEVELAPEKVVVSAKCYFEMKKRGLIS